MDSSAVQILLVDDSPSDVELTLHALRHNCVLNSVHVAHDGEEALDFIFCQGAHAGRSISTQPRLILLDLKLPKVDGIEVLRRLKTTAQLKSIPVVMLTSSKEEADILRTYELGVNSYIQKPVDFDQFRAAIGQLGLYWLVVNEPPPASALDGQ
ncbi:MAG: response regulator [Terriglobia bacterium]